MSNLSLFEPFRRLSRLEPFNDDLLRGFSLQPILGHREDEPQIRVDLNEAKDKYIVRAELPGVEKKDIKVSIDGNRVMISAEVSREHEEKEDNRVIRQERYHGSVSRTFSLPQDIDESKSEAHFDNGILKLTLHKVDGTGPHQLAIH